MKKTKLQELASTELGQIRIFIQACKYAKVNGAFGGKGITKQYLLDKGVTEKVFNWLRDNHYCNNQKENRPLWIAVNGNKLYPLATISNLEKALNEFESKQE